MSQSLKITLLHFHNTREVTNYTNKQSNIRFILYSTRYSIRPAFGLCSVSIRMHETHKHFDSKISTQLLIPKVETLFLDYQFHNIRRIFTIWFVTQHILKDLCLQCSIYHSPIQSDEGILTFHTEDKRNDVRRAYFYLIFCQKEKNNSKIFFCKVRWNL
jgi:hypothetical protein